MRSLFTNIVCITSFVMLFSRSAQAQTFQFSWYDSSGANPISSINVAPSSSFTATIFITQTNGPANYLGDVGMSAFSVGMNAGTASAPVSIASTANLVRNPSFDFNPPGGLSLTTNSASMSASIFNNGPVLASGSTNRVLLGTVTFQTGAIGSQSINLFDGGLGNADGFGTEIFPSSSSLGVTVVPEPATVLLLAAGGLGLCRVFVRRRKAAVAVPALAV